uniref:Uncharacterized protein n=1 Tax=Aegilops tauschii subsp. strangulata TaxID=200361 RepID=A0A453MX22_AEGTS
VVPKKNASCEVSGRDEIQDEQPPPSPPLAGAAGRRRPPLRDPPPPPPAALLLPPRLRRLQALAPPRLRPPLLPPLPRHHRRRNPPLLGCFVEDIDSTHFQPILEAPNRVPQARFAFPIRAGDPPGCRHGLVLFLRSKYQLLVWDPITGDQHRLDVPQGLTRTTRSAGRCFVLLPATSRLSFRR